MSIIKKFKNFFSKEEPIPAVYSVYNLTYDEIEYTLFSFLDELDEDNWVIKSSACTIKKEDSNGHTHIMEQVTCLAVECYFDWADKKHLMPILEKAIKKFNGEYNDRGIVAKYEYMDHRTYNDKECIFILIYNPEEYTNSSKERRRGPNGTKDSDIKYVDTPFAKSRKERSKGRPWFTRL